jgi:MurNAc alpha-1-phosphate uridylyltransferase
MILAAGRGTRMRPLTDAMPKPLLAVRGRPLIEHHVLALARAGIASIVINLSWLGPQIRDYLGDGARYGVAIRYSEEQPRPLEAAGGIFRALPLLGPGPFAVVNGDVFTDYPFEDLRIRAARDAHLVLVANPPHHLSGDFGLVGGAVVADAAQRHTFAGVAVYRTAFFDGCTDGVIPLKPLLLRSMAAGRCSGELYGGVWEDVGTPERLRAL